MVTSQKQSALSPKDASAKNKVEEAKKLVTVIEQQLVDAKTQKSKQEEEVKVARTKAEESSINSAKLKAHAEAAFRKQVVANNQICNVCSTGKTKISKRRQEIDTATKSELKEHAARIAANKAGKLTDLGPSIRRRTTPHRTAQVNSIHEVSRKFNGNIRKDNEKRRAEQSSSSDSDGLIQEFDEEVDNNNSEGDSSNDE